MIKKEIYRYKVISISDDEMTRNIELENSDTGTIEKCFDIGKHWFTATDQATKMELLLTDRQGNIILDYKPEEEQWWINGFNPQKQNVQENELISTTRIDFSNNLDMWNALYNDRSARKKWDFDEANHIAILR